MNVLAMPRDYRRKLKTTRLDGDRQETGRPRAASLLRAEAPAIKKLAHDSKTSDTSAPKPPGTGKTEGHSVTEHTDDGSEFLAKRLRALHTQADSFAHIDRVHLALPIIVDAVKRMRAGGLAEEEAATLLRQAAEELSRD